MLFDIFCRVIDNFGDLGVCWRLCTDLAQRGHRIRLWVDDAAALAWMAPKPHSDAYSNVQVFDWTQSYAPSILANLSRADVWIEAFGCNLPDAFVTWYATQPASACSDKTSQPVWINLEYLSAESYVERSHGLASPIMHGPAKGWYKYFYYPGFNGKTGGLLRELDLRLRQQNFQDAHAMQWLAQLGIAPQKNARLISLFCYEPPLLNSLFEQLRADASPTKMLVTAGRASAAVRNIMGNQLHNGHLSLHYLPLLSQINYDRLLWACDLNFVRGEDSLVRAIWAGKPFVWNIYPQTDNAHLEKLQAFLDTLQASATVRQCHMDWNQKEVSYNEHIKTQKIRFPLDKLAEWKTKTQQIRSMLWLQPDLCSQLIQFILKNR
jgi:uncharacterized repeat protein (TIGR03837 family)